MNSDALYFLNLFDIFIVFKFIVTCHIKLLILALWSMKYLFIYSGAKLVCLKSDQILWITFLFNYKLLSSLIV